MYSKPIQNLIRAFKRLPTVGERTAQRFVFSLLKSGKKDVAQLTIALKELMESIQSCNICWDFSDQSPCAVCSDPRRDTNTICVVAEPQDVQVIESVRIHAGRYHVLRGTLSTDIEESLTQLKIRELFDRIKQLEVQELILALNPDMNGETTALYLERTCKELRPDLKMTRLARGLPMGSDIQYADEMTLESAFKNRTSI